MRQLVKSSSVFTSLVLTLLFVGNLSWSAYAGNQVRVNLQMTIGGRDLGVMSFLEFEDRLYLRYGDWLSAIPVKVLKANTLKPRPPIRVVWVMAPAQRS